ncbi:MAG: histidine phosphatase family protein [Parcubacteria group bacterium]|nr:histidine phosphatase family protein [Parcubacteria group bacterium]
MIVISIRHAAEDISTKNLNEEGLRSASQLAEIIEIELERLVPPIKNGQIMLVSSPVARALQTAEPIAKILDITTNESACLGEDWMKEEKRLQMLFELLGENLPKVLIIVTHLHEASYMPILISEKLSGITPRKFEFKKGNATLLNTETGQNRWIYL